MGTGLTDSSRELLLKLMTSVTDRVEELGQQIAGAVAAHGRCREEILGRLAQFDKVQAQQQICMESVKRDIARLGGAGAWWLRALPVGLLIAFLIGLGGFFVRQEMILKEQQAIAEDLDALRDRWGELSKAVVVLETKQSMSGSAARGGGVKEEVPPPIPVPDASGGSSGGRSRFDLPPSKRVRITK